MSVLLFLSNLDSFYFFFFFDRQWLGLPNLCWIKVVDWTSLSCSWSYRKCFQVFTIEYDVSCGFVIYGLNYVEVCSLYAHFLENIFHKWVLNSVQIFSASIEMIIWFLFFNLLMWCISLIDLQILNNPCITGVNPTWSWCMIFFVVLMDLIC